MKTNFRMKGWAPGLASKKRPKVIRKWRVQDQELHRPVNGLWLGNAIWRWLSARLGKNPSGPKQGRNLRTSVFWLECSRTDICKVKAITPSSRGRCYSLFSVLTWRHASHVGVQKNSEKSHLGVWLYYYGKLERHFAIVLHTNIAVSSREWKPRIAQLSLKETLLSKNKTSPDNGMICWVVFEGDSVVCWIQTSRLLCNSRHSRKCASHLL